MKDLSMAIQHRNQNGSTPMAVAATSAEPEDSTKLESADEILALKKIGDELIAAEKKHDAHETADADLYSSILEEVGRHTADGIVDFEGLCKAADPEEPYDPHGNEKNRYSEFLKRLEKRASTEGNVKLPKAR